MRDSMIRSRMIMVILTCSIVAAVVAITATEVRPEPKSAGAKAEASRVAPPVGGAISGAVTSAKGPEAGVWVIAETLDLGTKYRKIVVTDDQGRYLLPDLPKAKYHVWVRGYGLVDSEPVQASPGDTLALSAVVAPSANAAAQYYPADYWFSLVQMPPKTDFPMTIPAGKVPGPKPPAAKDTTIPAQALWISTTRNCAETGCHQMGTKVTREISPKIGHFSSTTEALEREMELGQVGDQHFELFGALRNQRGLGMFSDWMDRIAGGEAPPPPRPARRVLNAT